MIRFVTKGRLQNEVVLGMIWLYLVWASYQLWCDLAKWPRTFVGKVAHLCRVYKTCHDTPYSGKELRTQRERNFIKF